MQALKAFPQDAELALSQGIYLMMVDPERAPFQIATAVGLDSTEPWLLAKAAALMLALDEPEAARSYTARAVQFRGTDEALPPVLAFLGGRLAALDGDFPLAEEGLRVAIEWDPRNATYISELAKQLADQGRVPEALALLDRAATDCDDPVAIQECRRQIASA